MNLCGSGYTVGPAARGTGSGLSFNKDRVWKEITAMAASRARAGAGTVAADQPGCLLQQPWYLANPRERGHVKAASYLVEIDSR